MSVSVVMSVYNTPPKTVAKALNSIAHQSYEEMETIVVFNGHNEASDLARSLGFSVYEYPDNLGIHGNWNRAVSLVNYPYITFVHADDTIDKDHVKSLAESIKDYDICFASLKYKEKYLLRVAHSIKRISPKLLYKKREFITDPDVSYDTLIRVNPFPVIAMMTFSAWSKLGGYTELYDWDMWIRAHQLSMSFTACKKPTYTYTIHSYPKGWLDTVKKTTWSKHGVHMITTKRFADHKRRFDRGGTYLNYITIVFTGGTFLKVFGASWYVYALGIIGVIAYRYIAGYIEERSGVIQAEQGRYAELNPQWNILMEKIDKLSKT